MLAQHPTCRVRPVELINWVKTEGSINIHGYLSDFNIKIQTQEALAVKMKSRNSLLTNHSSWCRAPLARQFSSGCLQMSKPFPQSRSYFQQQLCELFKCFNGRLQSSVRRCFLTGHSSAAPSQTGPSAELRSSSF